MLTLHIQATFPKSNWHELNNHVSYSLSFRSIQSHFLCFLLFLISQNLSNSTFFIRNKNLTWAMLTAFLSMDRLQTTYVNSGLYLIYMSPYLHKKRLGILHISDN